MSLLSVGRSSKTESLIPASSRLLGSNTGDIAVARPSLACSISSDGYIHPVGAVRVMSVLAMRRQQQQQQQQLLLLLLNGGRAQQCESSWRDKRARSAPKPRQPRSTTPG